MTRLGPFTANGAGGDARSPSSLSVLSVGEGVDGSSLSGDAQRPVFVLTVARSGSTLLRFILDSHPELACPPETNIGQVCFGLARLWDVLDPSPESVSRDFSPGEMPVHLPADAAAAIRGVIGRAYGRYMRRHGKRRWCDKSLDSAKMAELLVHLYPDAQFVCLYRHCLDVVVSAVEAAPWGLNGYGFDAYVANTPGNTVLAAARCWLDQTRAIAEFQGKHPDRCHGIRYEDLVTRPEEIAGDLFAFLGVDPVPGITKACLTQAHESRGPADHKIWFTSSVSAGSLGQGSRVPAGMLPPEFVKLLNETLDQLAYRQVDDAWKNASGPLDPRADVPAQEVLGGPLERGTADTEVETATAQISARLAAVSAEQARDLAGRWPQAAGQTLCLAVDPPAGGTGAGRSWVLSYQGSELTVRQDDQPPEDAGTLAAPAATWLALLGGRANMAAELRAGRIRLRDSAAHTASRRQGPDAMHLLARLIGLAGSSQPPSGHQQTNALLNA